MSTTRRQFLGQTAAAGAGAAVATGLSAAPALAATGRSAGLTGSSPKLFPALVDDPKGLLALPPGFHYRLVTTTGTTPLLDSPNGKQIGKSPGRPDGTGSFRTASGSRLVRNHELTPASDNPVVHVAGTVYDRGAVRSGGCTVVDLNKDGVRRSEWVGLSGTSNNCAGGVTPWGTWMSCEEFPGRAGENGFTKDHGYIFEVFPAGPEHQVPVPIKAFGRFSHEAAVIEPTRTRVYMTEDSGSTPAAENGLFYRWSAPAGVKLGPQMAKHLGPHAGTLEAMSVRLPDGSILPDLAYLNSAQIGRPFPVRWVGGVEDRDAQSVDIRFQFDAPVTRGHKLEGAWGSADGVYFNSSYNLPGDTLPATAQAHDGQLWFYSYRDHTLTLKAYFPYGSQLHNGNPDRLTPFPGDLRFDGPDNVHVTPYGGLIIVEDGDGLNHALSWRPEVGAEAIARNMVNLNAGLPDLPVYSELTGPTFSADGRILFVNVQEPGYTFAIHGPWLDYLA